jgi:hypothetical protein
MSKSPKKSASNLVECRICHVHYQLKEIGQHYIACVQEHNMAIQQKEFVEKKKTKNPRYQEVLQLFAKRLALSPACEKCNKHLTTQP